MKKLKIVWSNFTKATNRNTSAGHTIIKKLQNINCVLLKLNEIRLCLKFATCLMLYVRSSSDDN